MFKPRRHQLEAIEFHRRNPNIGTLLYHKMGLGKTATTLWIARDHMAEMRAKGVSSPKFMVIVPKSAVPTWRVECHRLTPDLVKDMVIYPYSQLNKAVKMLKYVDIRMIAFDESHYLKAPSTNRVKTLCGFLKELGESDTKFSGGRLLFLTGTPMPNGAAELYTTWALCSGTKLTESAERALDEDSYEKWKVSYSEPKKKRFETWRGTKTATTFEGVANIDLLMKLMAPITHYKRVEDCIDVPDSQEIHIDLGLPDDRLLKDADIEEPEAYMALLERLARAKAPYLIEWVEDFLQNGSEQLVVFSLHTKPLYDLQQKHPKDVVLITGKESGAVRSDNLKRFQEGKVRIIAMSYKAGSESLNLQNAYISLYSGWFWHDAGIKQAMARTKRSGQTKKTLHYFLTSGENDSRLLTLVRRKEEATTLVESKLISTAHTVPTPTLGDFI